MIEPPPAPPPGSALLERATLADIEAIRLLLNGTSIVDWHRLAFEDYEQVDRFLRVNEFDPHSARDLHRLEEIRDDAIEYLTRHLSFNLPTEVTRHMSARDLLLLASRPGRNQRYACMILKAMHVIHRLAGRELLFHLPISDDQIFGLVEAKVMRTVEELRAAGYPLAEFAWSRKERSNLITKLLAKRESVAANVYDRLRFRLTARSSEDLAPILIELTQRLIPFNYVIPGESVNDVLSFRRLLEDHPTLRGYIDLLQHDIDIEEVEGQLSGNEFSGPTYRVINFVADMPVRIEPYFERFPEAARAGCGHVIFVLTEFQVVDEAIALANDSGSNSHRSYKQRQTDRVRARLAGGENAIDDEELADDLADEDDD